MVKYKKVKKVTIGSAAGKRHWRQTHLGGARTMTGKIGSNPLKGREKDVLAMCEHFLEDDRIKDQPNKYQKKLAVLTNTVTLLKHLYGDDVDVDHLIEFISKKEVMEKDLLSESALGGQSKS